MKKRTRKDRHTQKRKRRFTYIRILKTTAKKIRMKGSKGQTYDDIIKKYLKLKRGGKYQNGLKK